MNAPDILNAAAATFRERNAVYGSNYLTVAPTIKALFPDGVPSELVTTDRWHLFELMIVKLSRFAISGLTHQDSIRDAIVYGAMVESLLPSENANIQVHIINGRMATDVDVGGVRAVLKDIRQEMTGSSPPRFDAAPPTDAELAELQRRADVTAVIMAFDAERP